jgi:hypothetical protein
MDLSADLPEFCEWRGEGAGSTQVSDARDTLANRPDLIAELERHLLAAGILAGRECASLWARLKTLTSACQPRLF